MTPPQTHMTAPAILAHLRSAAMALVPAERRVAEVLLARLAEVPGYSAQDVAGAAGCSTATVVRACQRLGFTGYQQFRTEITRHAVALAELDPGARENRRDDVEPGPGAVLREDSVAPGLPGDQEKLLEQVFAAAHEDLQATQAMLDRAEFTRAVDMLSTAGTILMLGTGGSSIPAQDAALRFTMAGRQATAPSDVLAQQFTARLLEREDVCVAISFSGANRHTLDAVDAAQLAGARVVAVTSTGLSPLAKLADACLVTGTASAASEILSSRVAHMLVLNALNLAVQQRAGQPGFGPSKALAGLLSRTLQGHEEALD
ncbi:MurR/RpiR family transcriptional regulator [Glutamicibacter ardleyensis]|uniref:MurR/RpiR family transcriptional regulator n=2 Tax=Glutamicibacter ardleyensis TaxID=225894 RepID=UPI003FD1FBCA